jgi:hypothetical protein
MLSEKEKDFILWWEFERERKRISFRELLKASPLGLTIVYGIILSLLFIKIFGGYDRADMVFNREASSLILVLLIASLLVITFIAVFSVRHKREANEQYYLELKAREKKEAKELSPGNETQP